MNSSELVTAANVDLSNCDREQVQYSGAVQPHNALVTVTEPDLKIVQFSANLADFLGLTKSGFQNLTLTDLLGAPQTEQLRQRAARESLVNVPPVHVLRLEIGERKFHVFAHRIDGVLVLEFENASPEQEVTDLYGDMRAVIAKLQNTEGVQAFLDLAVQEIGRFTGFERVLAYEFLPDGSGYVISESAQEGLESYLGLHYPASDIPKPARRLFSLTWLRHLPDVDYTPVPIVPDLNPATGAPLDLSYVAGRHVSVMYSKYLQNMGVKSTMVMTLLKNSELWGLVSCMSQSSTKYVRYETRMACEFLAHMVSLLMGAKEDAEAFEYKLKMSSVANQLIGFASREKSPCDGLVLHEPTLLSAVQAQGSAILNNGKVTALGVSPGDAELCELAKWLAEREDPIFVTGNLSAHYAPAAAYPGVASGLLAARLSPSGSDVMLWFRPEMVANVSWAGDPRKPVEVVNLDAETRLQPRTSFAIWKEEVRGRSVPWRAFEVEAVRGLRHALIEIVVDGAEELASMNRELVRSNVELDSFAYAASHDLKEPLRGIHNYSMLLQRAASDRLTDTEKSRLETVLRLTQRMDDLIEGLLQYSRVGRVDLVLQPVDLNDLVESAVDLLHARIEECGGTVSAGPLPTLMCDRVRIREVFSNLIVNALKYNDRDRKQVEIGWDAESAALFVRDNGIGIAAEHHGEIFNIFRRLHGRDEYGGGTGAGLTIVSKAVERHGGRMWVESALGQGSTFWFTLMAQPKPVGSGANA